MEWIMQRILIAVAMATALPTVASAQMASPHNPAVTDPSPRTTSNAVQGRNSFTQSQAQGRIAKAGYSKVGKLAKDENGVWQGKAMKDGKPVTVALDYKGDITTR
jgi:hypothetical protein